MTHQIHEYNSQPGDRNGETDMLYALREASHQARRDYVDLELAIRAANFAAVKAAEAGVGLHKWSIRATCYVLAIFALAGGAVGFLTGNHYSSLNKEVRTVNFHELCSYIGGVFIIGNGQLECRWQEGRPGSQPSSASKPR